MIWARHPGDSKFHSIAIANTAPLGSSGSTLTECAGRWPAGSAVEFNQDPPAIDRCGHCERVLAKKPVHRSSVADFDSGGEV